MDAGILLLRAVVGLTIAAHGAQKLFGWFKGPGRAGFAGYLGTLGFRNTRALAWLAGVAEFAGGLLFAFGLVTPLAVAAIIAVMLAATAVVHWRNGFFNTNGGFEFPLVVAAATATVGLTGPGAFAFDTWLGLAFAQPSWLTAGIVAGIVAALAVIGLHWADNRGSVTARTA